MSHILTTAFMLFFLGFIFIFTNQAHAADFPLSIKVYTETKPQTDIPSEVEELVTNQKKLQALTYLPTLRIPILMYHYVEYVKDEKDTTRIALNTYPHVLASQIETLKEANYTFLTIKQAVKLLNGQGVLPLNPVVLTFDDGYRDFYTDAYPILKKYNVAATQYVVSGFFNDPNYMTDEMVREIATDGLVEIAAHSETHPWLADKDNDFLNKEVLESKKKLEKIIGAEIVSFAYPYGSFDLKAIQLAKKAGYTSAVSTVPGIMHNQDSKYFLYRLRAGKRVGEELLNWISGSKFTAF